MYNKILLYDDYIILTYNEKRTRKIYKALFIEFSPGLTGFEHFVGFLVFMFFYDMAREL